MSVNFWCHCLSFCTVLASLALHQIGRMEICWYGLEVKKVYADSIDKGDHRVKLHSSSISAKVAT